MHHSNEVWLGKVHKYFMQKITKYHDNVVGLLLQMVK